MFGKIYKFILDIIRSSDFLTQVIWRVNIKKKLLAKTYDQTSLVLKKTLYIYYKVKKKHFANYLDMGCGQIAILGQYQKIINPETNVTSTDIYKDFLINAEENAKANNLDIKFVNSNLFENITEQYDLITFNPPYVPLSFKKKELLYNKITFSGEKGTDTINQFLQKASEHLKKEGLIFLGVNLYYVPMNSLINIANHYDYKKVEIIKRFPDKCVVIVLKK
tara:strand:+ start:7271 stop:7933 length:663 start_codon:yes stop_codon:yes gene_type:complete